MEQIIVDLRQICKCFKNTMLGDIESDIESDFLRIKMLDHHAALREIRSSLAPCKHTERLAASTPFPANVAKQKAVWVFSVRDDNNPGCMRSVLCAGLDGLGPLSKPFIS